MLTVCDQYGVEMPECVAVGCARVGMRGSLLLAAGGGGGEVRSALGLTVTGFKHGP